MKQLLEDRFSPVTDSWGFLDMPFDDVVCAYNDWIEQMGWEGMDWQCFESDLADALKRLEPFTPMPTLVAETTSNWTAIFLGGPSGGPDGNIAYFTWKRNLRGLMVDCRPDTYLRATGEGIPGGVQFTYYRGPADNSVEVIRRSISATNQCESGWEWHEYGLASLKFLYHLL